MFDVLPFRKKNPKTARIVPPYSGNLPNQKICSCRIFSFDVLDVNGANQTGFTLSHGTLRDGLRCSSSKAFIRPVVHRANLHISLQTFVEKILIRRRKREAYGVLVNKTGVNEKLRILANKEVIISAGAIQSPQLLMLSGIGPKKHLVEMKIPVIFDSPGVGENLQASTWWLEFNFIFNLLM